MTSYSTHAEFIERELHSMVIDTTLYDWDEVWVYLHDYADAILYDHESQSFRWNDESVYMLGTRCALRSTRFVRT